jgi:hypothetical protein
MKLKNEENLSAESVLARLTGKTRTNYKEELNKWFAYTKYSTPKGLAYKLSTDDIWQVFE